MSKHRARMPRNPQAPSSLSLNCFGERRKVIVFCVLVILDYMHKQLDKHFAYNKEEQHTLHLGDNEEQAWGALMNLFHIFISKLHQDSIFFYE